MHDNEYVATAEQVSALLAEQQPALAGQPVVAVAEFGTDHCLFRVGDALVARMPRHPGAVDQAASDARWLPHLAPHLPVAAPAPVALGRAGAGFPWAWSVAPWLPGRPPSTYDETVPRLAEDLAGYVRALHAIDTRGGPVAQPGHRGASLRHWDDAVRAGIAAARPLAPDVDWTAVERLWEDCVGAPEWSGPPVWVHGDLMAGNLLVEDGRLTAVIDYGALGVGDPAPDLAPAWSLLTRRGRTRFAAGLGYDEATWRRGRGWSLGPAITGIAYYWRSVPAFAERGLRTIDALLGEGPGS